MNHPRLPTRLGLAVSAFGLALLAACGGGGGDTAVAPQATVGATAQEASAPVAQNLCGVDAVATAGDPAFSTPASASMVINNYPTPIALLTSFTGYPFSTGLPTPLNLPMVDLREVATQGYTTTTTATMGVEVSSPFAAGSVACVAGISRVLPGTDRLGNPVDLVSLSSSAITNLPAEVQVQPGQPMLKVVNGIEFMHNLASQAATAVFRIDTAALADPSAARICHMGSSITCSAAGSISSDAGQWVLRAPVAQAGVYLLVAASETVPLD